MKKQKKNKSAKARLVAFGLYGITSLCFAASLCGTFAWYTYTTRTGLSFEGASVTDAGSLEIGVVSNVHVDDTDQIGLEEEILGNRHIYWSYTGLDAHKINTIIEKSGSATDTLTTVTSGKFHGNGADFDLYSAPTHRSNNFNDENTHSMTDYARKKEFVTLPLAFRFGNKEVDGQYVAGKRIFLSSVEMGTEEEITNSLRVFSYVNSKNDGYLINPSEYNNGKDDVGGPLDLDVNGEYDTFVDQYGRVCEFPYGQFVDGYHYLDTPYPSDIERMPKEETTTFDSNHTPGTYGFDLTQTIPETAEYRGISDFSSHRIAITKTDDYKNYGFVNLIIYIEGWDLSVINSNFGHKFTMNFTFEMD